jgi:hypothetical protein
VDSDTFFMKNTKQPNKVMKFILLTSCVLLIGIYGTDCLAHDEPMSNDIEEEWSQEYEVEDDFELLPDFYFYANKGCTKASSSQLATVNSGNSKKTQFQNACVKATGSSSWCSQVERPNPSSKSIFSCTYGAQQQHRLIHPTTSTWNHAIKAIQLIQKLQAKGICVSQIYNWWRPEPYNGNVGGAAGRHPFGTSVDVRFCSNAHAIRGFDELCKYRKQGQLRALGYYGSTGVHIGVGDKTANTWGRTCK